MKKIIYFFTMFPFLCFSQFSDDFSDGNFTINPTWIGDVNLFEVDTNNKLHLNDSTSGVASLVTESVVFTGLHNTTWEFSVRLDFSPSTNNYSKVYLCSDQVDLSSPLNGIYVRIGGQAGSIDDVSLYLQQGTTTIEIIDGKDSLVTNNPDVRVKVTRGIAGTWELFLDTNGVFFTQGTGIDGTSNFINGNGTSFFGVYCKYTITRSDKFWFDDFIVTQQSINLVQEQINDKAIMKIFNVSGQEVSHNTHNNILFYLYKDGSVKKRFILD